MSYAVMDGAILQGADLSNATLHGATGLTDDMLASLGAWDGLRLENTQSVIKAMGAACSYGNHILELAAPYDPEAAHLHPLVLLDEEGNRSDWTDDLPDEWWPAQAGMTELVACASNHLGTIETCSYESGAKIERRQWQSTLILYAAQSGHQLNVIPLNGSTPKGCPETTTAKGGTMKQDGDKISIADVREALSTYVHPDEPQLPPRVSTGG